MLSKVISRRDATNAQPLVFPSLSAGAVAPTRAFVGGGPAPDPADAAGMAALREKLRQTEQRLTAEKQEAFEAGRRQGDQQARAELGPVMERLNVSIAQILATRPELRHRAEQEVVQLALLIAKRVLHRQLSIDENALTALARVTFDRLARTESCTVTVHPQFSAALTAALPATQAARVRIQPDPDCALGTLIIHSAEGMIDASVDAQLEEISHGLADRLGRG